MLTKFCMVWLGFGALALAAAEAPETPKPSLETFDCILWPNPGGLIDTVTSPAVIKDRLESAWYDALLPALSSQSIQVHVPQTQSLRLFLDLIESSHPECIEGATGFIESEINSKWQQYIPILKVTNLDTPSKQPYKGEIIVSNYPESSWNGRFGVVHPNYAIGGQIQIEFWKKENRPQIRSVIEYYSSEEVLNHLLIGSIDAAAVPQGSFQRYLKENRHEQLLSSFEIIDVPINGYTTYMYLREDYYYSLLFRTLISETWLHDRFPEVFQYIHPARIVPNNLP